MLPFSAAATSTPRLGVETGEPVVQVDDLVLTPEHGGVEVVDRTAGVSQVAGLAGWGEEEVDEGHPEHHREEVELVCVEPAPTLAIETPLHGRDRGLRQPVAGELGQPVGDTLLGHPPALADDAEVVGDDGVHVHLVGLGGARRGHVQQCPSSQASGPSGANSAGWASVIASSSGRPKRLG